MLRLRNWAEFQAVMDIGVIASRSEFFVIHQTTHERWLEKTSSPKGVHDLSEDRFGPILHVGALVPKRCAKRAVTRNLIKRQIYNKIGAMQNHWPASWVMVIRLKKEIKKSEFISAKSSHLRATIQADLSDLFKKVKFQ